MVELRAVDREVMLNAFGQSSSVAGAEVVLEGTIISLRSFAMVVSRAKWQSQDNLIGFDRNSRNGK